MGSTSVQTAYSRTSLSCLHCFMMLASSKNASLDIVPGFSVLMATSVVLFHFPDKIRHRENSNFLHVWIIWLGIDVTKHVLDTSVHFPIHGWKISNKAFRLHSGFNSLSLNSLSLKRILISLNNICCFMFADCKVFHSYRIKKIIELEYRYLVFFFKKIDLLAYWFHSLTSPHFSKLACSQLLGEF